MDLSGQIYFMDLIKLFKYKAHYWNVFFISELSSNTQTHLNPEAIWVSQFARKEETGGKKRMQRKP